MDSDLCGQPCTYAIRFANQPGGSSGEGHFEIISLTDTLSINGNHLHISISDSTGKTIGASERNEINLLNSLYEKHRLHLYSFDSFNILRG
jgi:Plants and Prokaryotes Conserved (PCC) domain